MRCKLLLCSSVDRSGVSLVIEFAIDGVRRSTQPRVLHSLHTWFHLAVSWEVRPVSRPTAGRLHTSFGAHCVRTAQYSTCSLYST